MDILVIAGCNLSAVQPKDIYISIISVSQFINLIIGKLAELFPAVRMSGYVIIYVAVFGRIERPPVIFTVPVRLGEISTDHETFFTECIKHVLRNISSRIFSERTVHDRKIRLLGVKHTKALVMLGGENHVFHATFGHQIRPLVRIKLHRIY